jgi:hypothetical protein
MTISNKVGMFIAEQIYITRDFIEFKSSIKNSMRCIREDEPNHRRF